MCRAPAVPNVILGLVRQKHGRTTTPESTSELKSCFCWTQLQFSLSRQKCDVWTGPDSVKYRITRSPFDEGPSGLTVSRKLSKVQSSINPQNVSGYLKSHYFSRFFADFWLLMSWRISKLEKPVVMLSKTLSLEITRPFNLLISKFYVRKAKTTSNINLYWVICLM